MSVVEAWRGGMFCVYVKRLGCVTDKADVERFKPTME